MWRRVSRLNIEPAKSATIVLVSEITLNGMLWSASGSWSSALSVKSSRGASAAAGIEPGAAAAAAAVGLAAGRWTR